MVFSGQQWILSSQHTACGSGQHPQVPSTFTQQVLPSGHSDTLSLQITVVTAWAFFLMQDLESALHWWFLEQQCFPSWHAKPCGRGQQEYPPLAFRQVNSGGQREASGQTLSSCSPEYDLIILKDLDAPEGLAGTLLTQGRESVALTQVAPLTEHVVPAGQQCLWSSQHSA